MLIVIIISYTVSCVAVEKKLELNGQTLDECVFLYISNDEGIKSTYDHCTAAALRLQKFLLKIESPIDNTKIPVLVVFDDNADFSTMLNQPIDTDTVFVDSLQIDVAPSVLYGSIVAVTKIFSPANKLQHLLKDQNNNVVKPPFRNCCDLFQLIWFSQKIGLKIYEKK